jgi:hypothetical protein
MSPRLDGTVQLAPARLAPARTRHDLLLDSHLSYLVSHDKFQLKLLNSNI